ESALRGQDEALKNEAIRKYTTHFEEVFSGIDARIQDLLSEPVGKDEDPKNFVQTKLKLRCFELFRTFNRASQEALLSAIDELLLADGDSHPAELKFRAELATLLEQDADLMIAEEEPSTLRMNLRAPETGLAPPRNHPFFMHSEVHFSKVPSEIEKQIATDRHLLDRAIALWTAASDAGKGKLKGIKSFDDLERTKPGSFTDGHVQFFELDPKTRYELLVLGDLHGCYSVLKAALLQSHFFEKVDAYKADPSKPRPHLVLLGDYIDRGLFSLNGVFRLALQLYVSAPEFVTVLRGNHEYYVEYKGDMYGGVKPSESINSLKPHLSVDVFKHYARAFETMPNSFIVDRMLMVHAGIPRDRSVREKWQDMSTLNDPDIRFQMMWSDPSVADVVPADLQDKTARFSFGTLQLRSFLQRIGCNTLIRGHEKINEGFQATVRDSHSRLFTLFSAGGKTNNDLPANSSYRSVTPMALTLLLEGGAQTFAPWAPNYNDYNDPQYNAFFRAEPEIEHRA
ncbi:MAG: serine/threonine protein phosphatase, partial [Polyangiaceae bacterium]|nr:serine/threonine protein phosphatase [Polyangiaceae bacterium]